MKSPEIHPQNDDVSKEEDPMSANSRRRFIMSLMIPFTMAACAKQPASEQVARQFMEAYYVNFNPKGALEVSNGLAAEKLNHQVGLLDGVAPDTGGDRPKVDYRLVTTGPAGDNDASYIYEVHSNAKDIGGRKVFVKMRLEGGQWKVSQFSEEFQGMPAASQPTPTSFPQ